jgi:hypothetical protein
MWEMGQAPLQFITSKLTVPDRILYTFDVLLSHKFPRAENTKIAIANVKMPNSGKISVLTHESTWDAAEMPIISAVFSDFTSNT